MQNEHTLPHRQWPSLAARAALFALPVLAVCAMPLAAHGQTAAQTPAQAEHDFDIPAGPLSTALTRAAARAGVALTADAALIAGRNASALKGRMTLREALAQLLAGSRLSAAVEEKSLLIRPSPVSSIGETMLTAIRVKARREGDGSTEGSGAYTSRVTSIASKTDMAFREIPQSVSVVTREQIEDQKLVDINDALKLMPGITVSRMNDNSFNFYSRGFQITSMQIDGGAPMALGAYTYSPLQDMAF